MDIGGFFSGGSSSTFATQTNPSVSGQAYGAGSAQTSLGGVLYHDSTQTGPGGITIQKVTGGKITNQPKSTKTVSIGSTKKPSKTIRPASGGAASASSAGGNTIGGDTTVNDASTNFDINDPATAIAALQSNTLIAGYAIKAATNAGIAQMQSYNNAVSNDQGIATALDTLAHVSTLTPTTGQPAPLALDSSSQAQAQALAAPSNTSGAAIIGGLLAALYYLTKA